MPTTTPVAPHILRHQLPEIEISYLPINPAIPAKVLGRMCTGIDPNQVSTGPLGEPVFPAGIVGSIAHSKDFAIAATTHRNDVLSLGIDIEQVISSSRLQVLNKKVFTREESSMVGDNLELATLVFCAKEALYKMISPLAKSFINFDEGIVKKIDIPGGNYTIALVSNKPALQKFAGEYHGHIYKIENNIVALSVMIKA